MNRALAGDVIYFEHPEHGLLSGRVVAGGEHGATVDCDGERHQVLWDAIVGHKQRMRPRYHVVDEGEDGVIAQDQAGNRVFIRHGDIHGDDADDEERAMGEDVHKAEARPVVLLLKGGVKNRPGLSLVDVTDRAGHRTKRWKKTGPDDKEPERARRADEDEARGSAKGYGTHNLEAGDRVFFNVDGVRGHGRIIAVGKDGATVQDHEGTDHPVPWADITGASLQGHKPATKVEPRAAQEQVSPDKFDASSYYDEHNDPDVTADAIVGEFPAGTAAKIESAVARLETIEQTIDTYKQGDEYDAERQKLHEKIIDHFLSDEAIKAATPEDGAAPTFTLLGGRGGSGKSWFKGRAYDPDKAIVLDADEVKSMLPEYEGWNAFQVHEESGEIFDRITDAAQQLGLNIVHDATMKTPKKAVALVKRFKDGGYRTEAHYMFLPRQDAARRAVARFMGKTSRYVPVDVVLGNTKNEQSFDQVKSLVDKWSFRDNNVERGEPPKLISRSGGDSEQEDDGRQGLSKSAPAAMDFGTRWPAGRYGLPPGRHRQSGEDTGPRPEAHRREKGRLRKALSTVRRVMFVGARG